MSRKIYILGLDGKKQLSEEQYKAKIAKAKETPAKKVTKAK